MFDRHVLACKEPFTNLVLTIIGVDVDVLLYCLDIFEISPTIEESGAAVRLTFVELCHAVSASQDDHDRPVLFGGVRAERDERQHPSGQTFIKHLKAQKQMLNELTLKPTFNDNICRNVHMPSSFTAGGIARAEVDLDAKILLLEEGMEQRHQPELDDVKLSEATRSTVVQTASAMPGGEHIGPCTTWDCPRLLAMLSGNEFSGALAQRIKAVFEKYASPSEFIEAQVADAKRQWTHTKVSVSLRTALLVCAVVGRRLVDHDGGQPSALTNTNRPSPSHTS